MSSSGAPSHKALSKIACKRLQKELVEWQMNPPTGFKHKVTDNLQRNECKGHRPSSEDLKNAEQVVTKKVIVEYYMALEKMQQIQKTNSVNTLI